VITLSELPLPNRIAESGNYPVVSFRIETGIVAQDVEVATSLFNEMVAELAKNKLPFDIKVRSGSVDFVVQILVDFVDQIMANPTGAPIEPTDGRTPQTFDHSCRR
jgi:predicted TIM-barrel fold metal-dependent hydrolase